jgi:hypothetical protein
LSVSADAGIFRFVLNTQSKAPNSLQENLMSVHRTLAAVFSLAALAAHAQSNVDILQRDVNQQTRIQQGLRSGSLTTAEAARLEQQQSHIQQLQARGLQDGRLSHAEQARIDAAQDRARAQITAAQHNAMTGDPRSASSQRMQALVASNVSQQTRVENGLRNGSLTTREAAQLAHGQAAVTRQQAAAGADGQLGRREQFGLQRSQERQSREIFQQRHDAQVSRRP